MNTITKSKVSFKTDGNFAIHVTDLQKAESFYTNVMGFNLINKSANQLVYDTGAICLYINKDEKIIPFIPALEVKNYKLAKAFLIENGCGIVREFALDKAFYFTDPFGLLMDIIEKK